MNNITRKKINDTTMVITGSYESIFSEVKEKITVLKGRVKKSSKDDGYIESSWRYGINPFGLRVSIQFSIIDNNEVELEFKGFFVDAIDATGAANRKSMEIFDAILNEVSNDDLNRKITLENFSNARFIKWFLFLNATIVLGLIWTGPGAIIIPAIGFAGAFVSLFLSKWLAKRTHNIKLINPQKFLTQEEELLYSMVSALSTRANLNNIPEVGVYKSHDMNAFATGVNQNKALVAFSSALLEKMDSKQIEAVAAHEIAHIANRDMLGIVLLQGAINSIVLCITLPLNAFRLLNLFSDQRSAFVELMLWTIKSIVALILTFIGNLVVKSFSRQREYRADAFSAVLLGKDSMISALNTLATDTSDIPHEQRGYSTFKVSGRFSFSEIFSTHPLIEKRIAALENGEFNAKS